MLKQRGWAALLPIGLIAIAATGATVMVVEKTAGVSSPTLAEAVFKSEPKLREGSVTYEMQPAPVKGLPGGQK